MSSESVVLDSIVTRFERKGYRLPTEAEWEFAGRGLASTYYFWGNSGNPQTVSQFAVFSGNAQGVQKAATKAPNAFGLYDMVGNVWERTNNYGGGYPDAVLYDPTGPQTGDWNVIRGCSWNSTISSPPSSGNVSASLSAATYETGFRVVLRDTVHIPMLPDMHQVIAPDSFSTSGLFDAGHPVTFRQQRLALCTKGHTVAFRYIWGDGDTSSWLGGASHQHAYKDSGIYFAAVQARCTNDTLIISGFSKPVRIALSGTHFVEPAPTISGPAQGKKGVSYSFGVQQSLCNRGHRVTYYYDWGDGFRFLDSTLTAEHSWSKAGVAGVSVYARCAEGVCSDTSRATITIADSAFNAADGKYRSGMISFAGPFSGATAPRIDLSDSLGNQYDVIFTGYAGGSFIIHAPNGFYDMGSITVPNSGKAGMDSLVSCLRIIAPENGFKCCSSATSLNMSQAFHEMFIVKTSEGHYGLLVLYNYYAGGMDHFQYYWGYQSDGSRRFNPDIVCDASPLRIRGSLPPQRITAAFSKNSVIVSVPGAYTSGDVSLYDVRGRLVRRLYLAGLRDSRLDVSNAPAGSYVLKVAAGKQEFVYRFMRMR
jgi:hypothetical protein